MLGKIILLHGAPSSGKTTIARRLQATIVNKDISTVKGFSDRQIKAISQHAALVAGGIASGQITNETMEFFLESIKTMTENFLETFQGLIQQTIEKFWNAIVGVVWCAINNVISGATGLILPGPAKGR